MNTLPPELTVTWEVAAERLHCGRTTIFALIQQGKLRRPARTFGRKTTITVESLERLEREALHVGDPKPAPPEGMSPGEAIRARLKANRNRAA